MRTECQLRSSNNPSKNVSTVLTLAFVYGFRLYRCNVSHYRSCSIDCEFREIRSRKLGLNTKCRSIVGVPLIAKQVTVIESIAHAIETSQGNTRFVVAILNKALANFTFELECSLGVGCSSGHICLSLSCPLVVVLNHYVQGKRICRIDGCVNTECEATVFFFHVNTYSGLQSDVQIASWNAAVSLNNNAVCAVIFVFPFSQLISCTNVVTFHSTVYKETHGGSFKVSGNSCHVCHRYFYPRPQVATGFGCADPTKLGSFVRQLGTSTPDPSFEILIIKPEFVPAECPVVSVLFDSTAEFPINAIFRFTFG